MSMIFERKNRWIVFFCMIALFFSACNREGKLSESSEFYAQLGLEYLKLGDNEKAIEEFKKAISVNTENAMAHYNLGVCISRQGDKAKESLKHLEKAVSISPKSGHMQIGLGVAYVQLSRWDDALKSLRKAVELAPEDMLANYNLGVALFNNKDVPGAIKAYKKTIELNPEYLSTHIDLGIAYLSVNKFDEAAKSFEKADFLRHDSEQILLLLATAYFNKKDNISARKEFEKVLKINPDSYVANYYIGHIYEEAGEYQKAIKSFQTTIKNNPSFAPAFNSLGYLYANEGKKLDKAEQLTQKAISLDTKNRTNYLDTLAWVNFKKGNYQIAQKHIEDVLKAIDSNNSVIQQEIKFHAGMIYYKLKDFKKAKSMLSAIPEKTVNQKIWKVVGNTIKDLNSSAISN